MKNEDRTEVQLIKELRQKIAELENFPELDLDSAVEIDFVMYVQCLNLLSGGYWRRMLNDKR